MFLLLQRYNFHRVKVIRHLNHGPPVFNRKTEENLLETNEFGVDGHGSNRS
jgi:hypothetical protein